MNLPFPNSSLVIYLKVTSAHGCFNFLGIHPLLVKHEATLFSLQTGVFKSVHADLLAGKQNKIAWFLHSAS